MKKFYILFWILVLLSFQNHLKAQDVLLPEGPFKNFLINKYPSCFVNVEGNGYRLLDTTCTAIITEDSLEFHNLDEYLPLDINGIQYFTSLKYLNCSNTFIQSPPPLPSTLVYLDYSNCAHDGPFLMFPDILPNGLRHLKITNCDLGSFAAALPDSLRYFDCSNNMFHSLPNLPSKLDTLICYDQKGDAPSSNILSSLPTLPSTLKYLDCSNNAISSFGELPEGLIYFACYFMNVNTNPENFELVLYNLPILPSSLKILNCSANALTSLPPLPSGLIYLNCSNTYLLNNYSEVVGTGLTSLPELPSSLNYLNCKSAALHCLPPLPISLTTLLFDNDSIHCLPNTGNFTVDPPMPICDITNDRYQCVTYPVIKGKVFSDNNSNGIKDSAENFMPNVRVYIENGQSGYTNIDGEFNLRSEIGEWTLKAESPYYYSSVPSNFTYTFSRYDTVVNAVFAFQPIASVDSLLISIVPIGASRPGFFLSYLINYVNVGTTTVSPNIIFNYNNNVLTYNSSNNPSIVNTGTSLTLAESNLTPGQSKSFVSNFHIQSTATLGDTLSAYANISVNSTSSSDSTFSVITGSFDPNDKQGTPKLTPQQVAGGKYIEYLIRFQNTGTDTAFNIVVTDTLNALLNDASFQLVNSSHACRVTKKDNKVGFEFLNIQLPDSIVNEPASHGFIRFRIKPQTSVTLNTVIPNEASIYFDYNTRVLTNTANTTIAENSAVVIPPAPATISTFAAFTNADVTSALLRWSTIGEYNTDHFEIQEKTGSGNFINIGTEAAIGTGINSYSHNVTINADEVFYRIKMINNDGSFIYSDEVVVRRNYSININYYNI